MESLARQHTEEALTQSKSRTWQDQSFHYLPVPLTLLMSSYVFTHLHTCTYSQSPSELLGTQTKKLCIMVDELERCHIALPLPLPDPQTQPSLNSLHTLMLLVSPLHLYGLHFDPIPLKCAGGAPEGGA